MFYVKEKINDALSIETELSDENFDLFGSELYCDACSQKARSGE